jgi:hypothetical protein
MSILSSGIAYSSILKIQARYPPKYLLTFNRLNGVISQKMEYSEILYFRFPVLEKPNCNGLFKLEHAAVSSAAFSCVALCILRQRKELGNGPLPHAAVFIVADTGTSNRHRLHAVAWLRLCATSRNVVDSRPDEVTAFF